MHINKEEVITIDKVFNNTVIGSEKVEVDVKYLIENVVINATGVCYASLKKVIGENEVFFDNQIIELNIISDVIKAAYRAVQKTDNFDGTELVDK